MGRRVPFPSQFGDLPQLPASFPFAFRLAPRGWPSRWSESRTRRLLVTTVLGDSALPRPPAPTAFDLLTKSADSGDCGQRFRLNATMHSDRRRPPVPRKAGGVCCRHEALTQVFSAASRLARCAVIFRMLSPLSVRRWASGRQSRTDCQQSAREIIEHCLRDHAKLRRSALN